MLIKFARRLTLVASLGFALHGTAAVGEDFLPPTSSAFKNVGYTVPSQQVPEPIMDPPSSTPDTVLAPVVTKPVASMYADTTPAAAPPAMSYPTTCNSVCCTAEKKADLKKAAATAHKGLFYANDFSYLRDPCYDGCLLGDCLKEMCHSCYTLDIGGQYRARVHREENHRGLGLTGRSDDFLLHRTRLYADATLGQYFRVYGELLDANSNYERFNPRPIEENRWDAQNLFIDVTLMNNCDKKLIARAGRQELLLGNQRYASPLDWANTRRTFDGGRLLYTNADWSVDGFWLAPLERDLTGFDKANDDVSFYGVYSTYRGLENGLLDIYWMALDDDTLNFGFDSIGARYDGTLGSMLFEAEGAYQFGRNSDGSDHNAGFFVVGLGKVLSDCACKPTSWLYFDWASGADEQGAGNGHHHFFPLAHKWNGFMDLFGRRNLIDLNLLTTFQLSKKVKLLTWYHSFWLENDNDTPYNVTMSAFAPGVTPEDDHLGHEIDTVLTIGINERSNILFGYSHFWSGDYFDTPGLPFSGDADFFYSQYTLNF